MCSGREISYFGLARNLIRHLISPNQDDLSYSARIFISDQQIGFAFGASKLVKGCEYLAEIE